MPRYPTVFAALLMALACLGAARAAPGVVAHHGNWDVVCAAPEAKPKPTGCLLRIDLDATKDMQGVTAERTADGNLMVRLIFKASPYLPPGVDLAFDGETRRKLPFETCLPQDGGCIAEFDAAPFLDRMKAGGDMTLAFMREANSAVNANVSIEGFAEALAALDALAPPPQAPVPDASGTTTASFGAWKMFCRGIDDPPKGRLCNIVRTADDPPSGRTMTAVVIVRTGQPLFVNAIVAGDVTLRPGLAMAIDGVPQGVVQFDSCGQLGCAVQVGLADVVASRLKAGKTATFSYKVSGDQAVAIPVALDGLDAALAAFAKPG